ncbi:hypothetical protein PsorP6_002276 [Peronosclerospora sorghi]|uniref:Uncharacterized protein n=1 Tax=Peronosclerospora sorghi TaxID=230839 RepID=A0ACC0WY79_9STRA|nr:hypothetical protein PsorP6_002276 [Peronosclerospora sorghi]
MIPSNIAMMDRNVLYCDLRPFLFEKQQLQSKYERKNFYRPLAIQVHQRRKDPACLFIKLDLIPQSRRVLASPSSPKCFSDPNSFDGASSSSVKLRAFLENSLNSLALV